ncbi:MAG: hypothetical protein GX256_09215 [Fretibacterium sp.]|nr:hypothetical protein [Fretibacterium sp.]
MLKKVIFRTLFLILTLIAFAMPWLIWAPTGPWLLEPLVRRFGDSVVPSLSVERIEGSLSQGYEVLGARLYSGDVSFVTLRRLVVRPDWEAILSGTPWLKLLEVEGLSSDVKHLQTLGEHYGSGKPSDPSGLSLTVRPLILSLKDIRLETSEGPVVLESAELGPDGAFSLRALGGRQEFPLTMDGTLGFEPLEILSCDLTVGSGKGILKGRLMPPFDLRGALIALRLEEFLAFVPGVKGNGRLDGRFTLQGTAQNLSADGVFSLSGGNVMDVPVSARLPWRYQDGLLTLSEAQLQSLSTEVFLTVSADASAAGSTEKLVAEGYAHNISMKNLGHILAPQAGLAGEGGNVDFRASLTGAGQVTASLKGSIPEVSAQGKNLVKDLSLDVRLAPGRPPEVACAGRVLGGEVKGRGSVAQQGSELLPEMIFTGTDLDLSLLSTMVPALKSAGLSGKVSFTSRVGENFSVDSRLSSAKLTASGVALQDLTVHTLYSDSQVQLRELKGRIGKAPLLFSGAADLKHFRLRFDGQATGLDPRDIPPIKSQVQGPFNLKLSVEGTFVDPRVKVSLTGQNNRVANVPLRNLGLAAEYSGSRLTLPQTVLSLPGGTVSFQGDVALTADPRLNLSGSISGLNLKTLGREMKLNQLSGGLDGQIDASFKVLGPLSTAEVAAELRSNSLSFGETRVKELHLEAKGSMKSITIHNLKAKVNEGSVKGKGSLSLRNKDMLKNKVELKLDVKGLELRRLLRQFMAEPPVGGVLNGALSLTGAVGRPELSLRVDSPLTIKETLVDRMVLSVQAPDKDRFALHASGKVGDLTLSASGEVRKEGGGWSYSLATAPLDLNHLVSAKSPSMKGKLEGQATAKVKGSTAPDKKGAVRPTLVTISVPSLKASGLTVTDILLPVQVTGERVLLKEGKASLYGGTVGLDADMDLNAMRLTGTAAVRKLDMGAMAQPFLPEGAIVGTADVNVRLRGNFSGMAMFFANGDFETSSGYLHEMEVIDLVSETKKLSFKTIRGSFFWDGSDLQLNPGTQAIAEPNDPFYRYFSVNGSMGLPGKGLNLVCQGRFDVKLLDSFLGALKGVFEYFTGGLKTGGGLGVGMFKGAVGKMLGIQARDFQDVSFILKGSWSELQLLRLKIDKPLKHYLPLDTLNEEKRLDDKKFRLNLKIPTGPGDTSPEEDPEDQFKQQLLDNLFQIGE